MISKVLKIDIEDQQEICQNSPVKPIPRLKTKDSFKQFNYLFDREFE